jgi:hypothetical protein
MLSAHAADQRTCLRGDRRPSWPPPPMRPPHELANPLSAPAADGVCVHDLKGFGPSHPPHGSENPQASISRPALGSLGQPLQDGQLTAQGHRRQRERHTLAQHRGQLLTYGLPTPLHDWPAWTWSAQKSRGFTADELLVTTGKIRTSGIRNSMAYRR